MIMYLLTGILGFLAVISPFVFQYENNIPALWMSVLVGIALLSIAGMKLFDGQNHVRRVGR